MQEDTSPTMSKNNYEARLFVEDTLSSRKSLVLKNGQGHYLRAVLRLKSESKVALFNGIEGEWLSTIKTITKKYVELEKHIKTFPSHNGNNTDILVINTNDCYHKGGYIKKKESYRLLLHVVFDPIFAFTDQGGNPFLKRIFTFLKNISRRKIFLN